MNRDAFWMQRALGMASQGRGVVEPNPMVGAVVLCARGLLAGMGYHRKYGGPHAEVDALQDAGVAARNGTIYVTLEPCSHFGKTPPCVDAILQAGLRHVVVAMADPFPQVAGKGIARLREAGLLVDVGVGEQQARALNAPYLKLLGTGRPWVIGKWAMTLDGKIATATGDSQWISNDAARATVHRLRGRVDAIIVGGGTVRRDNPTLTARPAGPRQALRVVVTKSGVIPPQGNLWNTRHEAPLLLVTTNEGAARLAPWTDGGPEVLTITNDSDADFLTALLQELGRRRFTNVMVEGGPKLLGHLHDANLLDETWVYVGAKLVGGSAAPSAIGGVGNTLMAQARIPHETKFEILGDNVLIRSLFTKM